MAMLLVKRRGDPVRIEAVSDPDDPDSKLYQTGALLPGPHATLAGPTFEHNGSTPRAELDVEWAPRYEPGERDLAKEQDSATNHRAVQGGGRSGGDKRTGGRV
jgi:hypothetical protein